jgi:hypothetical protein
VHLDSTTNLSIIGSGPGVGLTEFNTPYDLLVTNTSLYVVDAGNLRVKKSSLNGSYPTNTLGYGIGCSPMYLYVDSNSSIYLTCYSNHTALLFPANSTTHTIVAGTGLPGLNNNQLNTPYGIFVNNVGTIYIADCWNHRIMKWLSGASSGSVVAGNGTAGVSSAQLSFPTDIIVDINEYMYISESGNERITRWGPNSTFGECIAACTGVPGTMPTQLNAPHSLAFDSSGSLYVCEWANNRVQKFEIIQYHSEYSIK